MYSPELNDETAEDSEQYQIEKLDEARPWSHNFPRAIMHDQQYMRTWEEDI